MLLFCGDMCVVGSGESTQLDDACGSVGDTERADRRTEHRTSLRRSAMTMRCDVQLPVSETLNAPTGARNTVQAIGAVR